MQPKFLGRPLDVNTMTYSHGGDDLKFPAEAMQEVDLMFATPMWGRFIRCMAIIENWKDKLSSEGKP